MANNRVFYFLDYDVTEVSGISNPSDWLRRRAVRTSKSVWIIEDGRQPWNWINRALEAGCTVDVYKLDASELEHVLRNAQREMIRALTKRQEAERLKLDDLVATLEAVEAEEGVSWDRIEQARTHYRRERDKCLKATEKLVRDLETAASAYGIDTSTVPLHSSRERVSALKAMTVSRASLYAAATVQAQSTPLAQSATDESIPASILADYLEESTGTDQSALRAAFSESMSTTVHPSTENQPQIISSTQTEHTGVNGRASNLTQDERTPVTATTQRPETITPPAPALAPSTRTAYPYTVRVRTGVIRVSSTLTDREAADICSRLTEHFPRDLANTYIRRGRISSTQRSWLHVLAVGEQTRLEDIARHERETALAEQEAERRAIESEPSTITPTAPPVCCPETQTVVRPALDDRLPHEQEPIVQSSAARTTTPPTDTPASVSTSTVPVISTEKMKYDAPSRTLSIPETETGLSFFPPTLDVRSHKKGNVKRFTLAEEEWQEGEMSALIYRSEDGITLRVNY